MISFHNVDVETCLFDVVLTGRGGKTRSINVVPLKWVDARRWIGALLRCQGREIATFADVEDVNLAISQPPAIETRSESVFACAARAGRTAAQTLDDWLADRHEVLCSEVLPPCGIS